MHLPCFLCIFSRLHSAFPPCNRKCVQCSTQFALHNTVCCVSLHYSTQCLVRHSENRVAVSYMGKANVGEQHALDQAHVLLDACIYSCTTGPFGQPGSHQLHHKRHIFILTFLNAIVDLRTSHPMYRTCSNSRQPPAVHCTWQDATLFNP